MDNPIFASTVTLAQAIRNKEISSVELVQAYLDQIEIINPKLNAIVQLVADSALAQAKKADAQLAKGKPISPLHGVPMTIKDSFDTAGVISTWGTVGRKNYIPEKDATIVARLKVAGAILLGKTNTPEFTLWGETDNLIYGRSNNPYNLDRTPGGSSGGAAAIVAAGGSPFDIGTDTKGSIRQPSHFCGIAGIKPTSGRVPRTGHAIDSGGLFEFVTQVGPMARYVEDLILLLPIIAGPDGRDPHIAPVPLNNLDDVILKQLRGVFYLESGLDTPTAETVTTVHAAITALSEAGIVFEEKRPYRLEEAFDVFDGLTHNWDGGAWKRRLLEQADTPIEQTTLRGLHTGKIATPEQTHNFIARWDQFRTDTLTFMDDYDLIISPASTHPAIFHGTLTQHEGVFSYTSPYNLTGWPGAVVRVGTSSEGLPIGVQIVGKPWREDVVLAVAKFLEGAFGGWKRP